MKVLKFGGTSVGSAESIQTLLQIVQKEISVSGPPVVVVSAMSGVTNLLSKMAEKASVGEDYALYLSELETRHFAIIKTLLDVQRQNPVFTKHAI